jgi:hypothetical protein
MGVPCDKTEVISMINETVKETRRDVKDLLAFKNKALGIIITVTVIFQIVAFALTTLLK